jgi:hypothetical protein
MTQNHEAAFEQRDRSIAPPSRSQTQSNTPKDGDQPASRKISRCRRGVLASSARNFARSFASMMQGIR